MIEIFKQYSRIKFVKLMGYTKLPAEKQWQKKPYDYKDALAFHKKQNYGVLGGYGDLIIIDADKVTSSGNKDIRFKDKDNELIDEIESSLPETLTIQSGSGARHYYYFCKDIKKKIILQNNNYHWGEIISFGSQAVGPGSIHPETKNIYKIIKKNKIQELNITDLYKVVRRFVVNNNENKQHSNKTGIDDLQVTSIFSISGLKKAADGQLYGSHPIHGSSGGANFWINPDKNTWFCFRCNSGGGPASAIAVNEGIINCGGVSGLRGKLFLEVLKVGQEKYGLQQKEDKVETFEEISDKYDKLKLPLWTFEDFENYQIDNNFLIYKVIYPKTITMLYSPPGEFKSIMAMYMAMAIAQGTEWVGFKAEKNAVLYCDKENNDRILKERLMALYKGNEYEDKQMPLYFLRREGDLIRNQRVDSKFLEKLFYNIELYNIKVIFFDTMHRFGDYDENSSDDINLLYTQVFQPLIEKYECSVIFLHHTNKDGNFRGSGDFLGMVDTAYKFKRKNTPGTKSNKFYIHNEKNRSGEVETINAELEFNMREEGEVEVLDSIEIIIEDNKEPKTHDDFFSKVKQSLSYTDLRYKRDIKELLENQGLEFSLSKLKRALTWLVEKELVERDHANRYKLVLPEGTMDDTLDKEEIMEDV